MAVGEVGGARHAVVVAAERLGCGHGPELGLEVNMGPEDVPLELVRTVVARLPQTFCTWDVLEDPHFVRKFAADDGLAAVGKCLRDNAATLGILYQKDRRGRKGSALFKKIGVRSAQP